MLEQELALELGMSRTPVREALVRLQNERFVQLIPRHGMRVVPLSMQDLREVYEVLTSLELTAIERLARSELDDETVATIERILDEMDLAVRKKDVDGWAKADERFHRYARDALRQFPARRDGGNAVGAGAPGAHDHGPAPRVTRSIESRTPRRGRCHSPSRLAPGAGPPHEAPRAGDRRDPQLAPANPPRTLLTRPLGRSHARVAHPLLPTAPESANGAVALRPRPRETGTPKTRATFRDRWSDGLGRQTPHS